MKKLNAIPLENVKVSGLHDGKGAVFGGRALQCADLGGGAWDFVDYWRMPPHTSIGEHLHEEGYELYFIIRGHGVMTTNGEPCAVQAGDMILNEPGDRHMLENTSSEDLYCLVTAVIEK